jgi:hypothetical protein
MRGSDNVTRGNERRELVVLAGRLAGQRADLKKPGRSMRSRTVSLLLACWRWRARPWGLPARLGGLVVNLVLPTHKARLAAEFLGDCPCGRARTFDLIGPV